MPVRLPFVVVACSGEDPDCPCRELQYNVPDSRGWCTPRYCQYPQEFVVKLDQPAQLAQIQLLSHEYKIAAKVEIHVGLLPEGAADMGAAQWRRLGHLSFDPNERSQLSARELKSVVLSGVAAQLVRFQIARCHANARNVYGQAGIIALNLIGDPIPMPLSSITNTAPVLPAAAPSLASLSLGGAQAFAMPGAAPAWAPTATAPAAAALPPQLPRPAVSPGGPAHLAKTGSISGISGGAAGVAAELHVDVATAQKILELQEQKKQAIDAEDYDEAKRLKAGIDKLKAVGTKIAQLEAKKRDAVEEEDYDLAKELKQEVDRLRAAAYAAALSGEGSGGAIYDSFKSPVPSRRGSVSGAVPGGRRPSAETEENPLSPPQQQQQALANSRSSSALDPSGSAAVRAVPASARGKAAGLAGPSSDSWLNYDERPAQAKGVYSFDGASAAATPPPGPHRTSLPSNGRAAGGAEGGNAPPGFPTDLPAPEALAPADAKDAQPLVDLLGDYTTRALFSKTWQLREAALQVVVTGISGGSIAGLEGSAEAFRTLSRAMGRMVRDKVAGVFQAALKVLRELVACQAPKLSARDVQGAVGELLPVLVEKASDLNPRVKEQATELLVYLAGVKQAGLPGNTQPFVRPAKSQAAWKVVLGRLQLLSALLPAVGMAGRGASEGFQLDSVMQFVGAAFGNPSAEVRAAAVQLTLQVFDIVGPTVQRYLPADLNSKVKEQIEQGMLNRPAPGASGATTLAGPRPSVSAAASGTTPARPPAPKSAAPGKKAAAAAGGGGFPGTAGPGAVLAAQQNGGGMYPPSPGPGSPGAVPSPGAGGAELDDPALFEAELRAREARLGPGHPDVAEALSNLAILHNQRGDTARALPLYERALAIWEAACGPGHPDVAHTLTDIAVIHLEQGRDDIGRPLLERALAIQERHLGPDHPDVVAIRDVLNEEA